MYGVDEYADIVIDEAEVTVQPIMFAKYLNQPRSF